MREFLVKAGHFAGTHYIFDNREEFKKYFPDLEPKRWGDESIDVNDWVIADDGYILQCLRIYTPDKNKYKTKIFRFCNGSFYYYYGKSGKKVKAFYGGVVYFNKNSIGGNNRNTEQRIFLKYIEAGYPPIEALKKVHDISTWHKFKINKKLREYMNGEYVMKALIKSLDINEKVKQLTGKTIAEIVEDEIIKQVTHLNNPDLSLKEGREIVKFLKSVFGYDKVQNSEEVPYEEDKPPLLK